MRRIAVVALPLMLGAGSVLAQSAAPVTTGAVPTAKAAPGSEKERSGTRDGLAECMQLWDAKTHMSRQQWQQTCKRIQTRLDNLKIENLKDPMAKAAARKRKGDGG
jgi:hypothetical protein